MVASVLMHAKKGVDSSLKRDYSSELSSTCIHIRGCIPPKESTIVATHKRLNSSHIL